MTADTITGMCSACAAGLYSECENPTPVQDSDGWIIPCAVRFEVPAGAVKGSNGRPVLAPNEITDVTSTGRKRAAMLAPVLEGMLCEWAGLKHAGGGAVPIVGCEGNRLIEQKQGDPDRGLKQGDRHHGPDKSTINNAVGTNLHRICVNCHHRWHAANDGSYDPEGRPDTGFPFLPVVPYWNHDAVTRATDDDRALADEWWSLPKKDRGPYPFRPDPEMQLLPLAQAAATLLPGENPFPDSPFAEIGES